MTLNIGKPSDPEGLAIEAWAQGFMVGGLLVMTGVAVANMRPKVLLHRLIILELIFGTFHGTFIFTNPPVYNWYLSATAIFLNISWSLHNVIAWMKNKPFLGQKASWVYIGTVILAQPYWVLEITANFVSLASATYGSVLNNALNFFHKSRPTNDRAAHLKVKEDDGDRRLRFGDVLREPGALYFSGKNDLFVRTRPYEVLFRDPWWIFTVGSLFWNISNRYEFGLFELIRISPRFGVLLVAMVLSICFIIVDILAVTHVISAAGLPDGINPFWKLAFVFKCLTDTIVLDDFKTALDRLKQYKMREMGNVFSDDTFGTSTDVEQARTKKTEPAAAADVRIHDWSAPEDDGDISFADALRVGPGNEVKHAGFSGG